MSEAVRTVHIGRRAEGLPGRHRRDQPRPPGPDARPVAARHACSWPAPPGRVPRRSGREFATPDDVKSVAIAVLAHRVVVRPDAASRGLTAEHGDPRGARRRAGAGGALMLTRNGWGAIALAHRRVRRSAASSASSSCSCSASASPSALIVAVVTLSTAAATACGPAPGRAARRCRSAIPPASTCRSPTPAHAARPVLQLWEPVGRHGWRPDATWRRCGPRERSTAAYRVPTTRRGVVRIGPLRAERTRRAGPGVAHVRRARARARCWSCPEHTPARFALGGSSRPAGRAPADEGVRPDRQRVPLAARVRARRRPAPHQLEGVGPLERR